MSPSEDPLFRGSGRFVVLDGSYEIVFATDDAEKAYREGLIRLSGYVRDQTTGRIYDADKPSAFRKAFDLH